MVAVASVGLSPSSCPTQRRYTGSDSDVDECWICLSSEPPGTLARVCDCPRVSHRECLARWQLTNYGRREENFCRFCNKRLPALWKPDAAKEAEKEELRVAPVMAVRYNGPEGTREFKLRVRPGPEGLATFKTHLKEILGFDVGPEFDVTFECQMPSTGSMLTLSGLNSYGAATHCAALLAATKADAQVTAAAVPTTGGSAEAAPLSSAQQHQERIVQTQRHEAVVPPLLLPSEVPSTTEAPSGAGSMTTHHSHCSRRVCQTGYMPHAPGTLQPPDLVGGPHGSASPFATSYAPRARTVAPVSSMSLGANGLRYARRASEEATTAGGCVSIFEDTCDDLLPLWGRHGPVSALPQGLLLGHDLARASSNPTTHMIAAAGQGGAGDQMQRGSGGLSMTAPGYTWTSGVISFGARVLAATPSGGFPPADAVAAVGSAIPALVGPRFATTIHSGSRGPLIERDVRRGLGVAPVGMEGSGSGSLPSAAAFESRSGSINEDSVGISGGSLKDLMPLGSPVSVCASAAMAAIAKGRKSRSFEHRSLGAPVDAGNDSARVGVAAMGASGARHNSHGRVRLPSMLREVARSTVDSISRVLWHRKE
ncbi:hypothetical protein Vretimale_16627 [Volvox reticuliferus]|uniref:RING-CH-type domain-containing protein n=1 Tax=Volvox reticuliferus TaxID=1737510 RepID=A0A8J4GTK1_9CHLO|nr:hypothetical protein Vretifemale_17490 [Volvox reticuliferus]GIM13534.1 hypothetical protein Vretimale_16627 [Volvox reticuliferus]